MHERFRSYQTHRVLRKTYTEPERKRMIFQRVQRPVCVKIRFFGEHWMRRKTQYGARRGHPTDGRWSAGPFVLNIPIYAFLFPPCPHETFVWEASRPRVRVLRSCASSRCGRQGPSFQASCCTFTSHQWFFFPFGSNYMCVLPSSCQSYLCRVSEIHVPQTESHSNGSTPRILRRNFNYSETHGTAE